MLSIEYIAGFFDADGCITIVASKRGCYSTRVIFTNTNYKVLTLIQYSLSLCEIKSNIWNRRQESLKHAKTYGLHITKQSEIVKFCNLMKPYLTVKQEETCLTLKFLILCKKSPRGFNEEKFMLYHQVKDLKKRN